MDHATRTKLAKYIRICATNALVTQEVLMFGAKVCRFSLRMVPTLAHDLLRQKAFVTVPNLQGRRRLSRTGRRGQIELLHINPRKQTELTIVPPVCQRKQIVG